MKYLMVILASLLIITVSCATPRGDAQKVYTLSITGVCLAPGCTITHTTRIEIKADVKKDQKADATQTTAIELKAAGL